MTSSKLTTSALEECLARVQAVKSKKEGIEKRLAGYDAQVEMKSFLK